MLGLPHRFLPLFLLFSLPFLYFLYHNQNQPTVTPLILTKSPPLRQHQRETTFRPKATGGIRYMGEPQGRTCNQLYELGFAMEYAKRHDEQLILWGPWSRLAKNYLSTDRMRKYMNAPRNLRLSATQFLKERFDRSSSRDDDGEGDDGGGEVGDEEEGGLGETLDMYLEKTKAFNLSVKHFDVHEMRGTRLCTQKRRMRVLREIIRPNLRIVKAAKTRLETLKSVLRANTSMKNELVVSMHQRWMEGRCDFMMKRTAQNGSYCHSSTSLTSETVLSKWSRELCPITPASLEDLRKNRFHSAPSGVFLLTDYENPDIDEEILKGTKESIVHRGGASMLVDMWLGVESDYHVGNPGSSCDAIVAQWRFAEKKKKKLDYTVEQMKTSMYPRECYEGFFVEDDENDDPPMVRWTFSKENVEKLAHATVDELWEESMSVRDRVVNCVETF